MGWLFGNDPGQLSYLYGWLLHQNIFWVAMAISTVPALFGKKVFLFTSLSGFAIALLASSFAGTIQRVQHMDTAITAGLSGAVSFCILRCNGHCP